MPSTTIGPNYILDKTFTLASGQTITGYQVVYLSAAGECTVATNDTAPYLGVAQIDPNEGVTLTAGNTVRVRMMGISKVMAGEAITINTKLAVTVGQGYVTDTTPGTAADYYLGVALEAATQLNDIITVDLSNKNSQYFAS